MASDSRLRFEIDRVRGEAKLSVTPGEPVTHAKIAEAAAAQGIKFGITFEGLPDPVESVIGFVIARARPSVRGTDGVLELLFPPYLMPGLLRKDGSMDFHERGYLHQVRRGEGFARYLRPTTGEPGKQLDGAEIAASPGAETLPPLGPNVRLQQDGSITAERDGVIVHVPGKVLDVTDLWEHKGDVDFARGNLDVRGSLVVGGDVRPLFSVHATGDVVVKGHVDGGEVRADANATVVGSVIGSLDTSGLVEAGGDLLCHHAIDAELRAGRKVELQDSAYRTDIEAHTVICERGHGRIVGGSVRASVIHAKAVGSESGIPTLLAVGALDEERRELRLVRHARDLATRTAIKRDADERKRGKSGRASAILDRSVVAATLAMRRRQREVLVGVEIVVTERAHAGTVFQLGSQIMRLERDHGAMHVTFDLALDRIDVTTRSQNDEPHRDDRS